MQKKEESIVQIRGPGPGPVIRDTPLDPCASRVHSFGNKHSTSLARGHPKNCEILD